MSRFAQLMPPQPPLPRSLWPTDTPLPVVGQPSDEARTEPRIALPWAAAGPEAGDAFGQAPQKSEDSNAAASAPARPRSGPAREALVPLDAAALPYRLEAHVSLAVALDVLATRLSPVEAKQTVLSAFTEALLGLRLARSGDEAALGEEALEVGAQLRRTALGPTGEARAALAPALTTCAQVLGQVPTAADGVVLACAQIIEGSQEVVLRARLALEAKQAQSSQSRPGAR